MSAISQKIRTSVVSNEKDLIAACYKLLQAPRLLIKGATFPPSLYHSKVIPVPMNKLIFNCTHGKDDPERASLPFVAGNVAATAGQEAIVFCTIDAVWLGTKGGTDGIATKGLDPLSKIYSDFVGKGGKVWLCGACTKPRGIMEGQLAEGATIVGAAKVVEEIASGASTTSFG